MEPAISHEVQADRTLETAVLPDGRRIVVRPATLDDRDGLAALYRRLPPDDLFLRFFTAAAPSPTFLENWSTIADRGGLLLVAFGEDRSGRSTLVAEAGYSRLHDGDGELGITVDPLWRGWLGAWLLAVLLREASHRGVPNLQAVVQITNRPMLSVLGRHGPAVMEQHALDEIRLVIGTSAVTSTWPEAGERRPRILVEATWGRWLGEDAARAAGFEIRTCRGPDDHRECPMLSGGNCPLVDGADVVIVKMPPASAVARDLIAAHERHPQRELIVPAFGSAGPEGCETAEAVVGRIGRALGIDRE